MLKMAGFFLSYLLKGVAKMIIILSIMAGAVFGFTIGVILGAKKSDFCKYCAYKWFYIDHITEEINNGSGY